MTFFREKFYNDVKIFHEQLGKKWLNQALSNKINQCNQYTVDILNLNIFIQVLAFFWSNNCTADLKIHTPYISVWNQFSDKFFVTEYCSDYFWNHWVKIHEDFMSNFFFKVSHIYQIKYLLISNLILDLSLDKIGFHS